MHVTQRPQRNTCVYRSAAKLLIALLFLVNPTLHAQQQFRAAWADIFHVGMQNSSQVDTMVNTLVSGHYNAVIVQVLGYMDQQTPSHGAYWKSSIVPTSGYVTSTFDPLAYLCTKAHANGIEVHAWLGGSGGGPYRVSTVWPPSGNSTLSAHPEWFMVPSANSEGNSIVTLDGSYLLDMGSSDAQEYIVSIVKELVTNYPIDGINWDDEINGTGYTQGYGYPCNSTSTYTNSGLARYRRNTGATGTPSNTDVNWSNYRRRFKGELFARCQAEIESIKTNPRQPVRHTVAPLAYDSPPTSCTFTSLAPYTYFCDWFDQVANGWVDAAIPQVYRNYQTQTSSFNAWVDKSATCWQHNRQIFPGLGAYLNSMSDTLAELNHVYADGLAGTATYSYGVPMTNTTGSWWSFIATNLYTDVVSTPSMPWRNPATATEGIMWGRVKDYVSGNYVDDATVTVTGGSTVKTDGNGYFIATLVPATAGGTVHQLVASKTGMISGTNATATAVAGDVMRYDITINISAPSVTGQPLSQTVGAGTNATFSVTATGTGLSYQWRKNTVNMSNGGNVAGVTSTALTITGSSTSDAASYTVVVSNIGGSATSSTATLTVADAPSITSQPQSDTSLQGQTVFFTVSSSGTAPFSYQWRKNGGTLSDAGNISGSTTSALTIRSVGPTDAASYNVIVSNITKVTVASTVATLTIVSNVIPLVSMTSNVDASVSMTWQTDSGTSYTFQYKSNLTDLNWTSLGTYVANSSTLTLSDGPFAATQRFYQLISSQRASDPAGVIKLPLLGSSDNFTSLPFARPGGTRCIVSSVSGNVITADGTTGWTANQFVYVSGTQSNTYYARFTSGALEGRIYPITGNTANSITLSLGSDDLSSLAPNDSIAIEPYWTLNTAFPGGAGIIASPLPGNRYTELLIPDTSSAGANLSAAKIYFYNSGIWKQFADGSNVHNDDVLQPNSHFIVRHNVATNTTFTVMGLVVTADLSVALRTQSSIVQDNYIGLMRPAPVSLNTSGLISSGAFQSSPVPGSRTDELLVFDNTAVARNKSASAVYYYWSTAWRQVGAGTNDVGTNLVSPGTGFIIRKATNNVSPVWLNSPNW